MSSWKGSVPRVRTTPDRSSTSNLPPAAENVTLLLLLLLNYNPITPSICCDLLPCKPGRDISFPPTDCYRKPLLTSVPDEEVVEVVVCVRVLGLQREHGRVGRRVQLDHGLHRQRPVDEVGRLVIDVLDLDDDTLVVRVCNRRALALVLIIIK